MEENIKITIEGEGLHLVKQTNLQKAGQIISFLALDKNNNVNSYVQQTVPQQNTLLNKSQQPRDIIVASSAKTFPQKITAIAVYIRDQRGQNNFTPEEIRVILKKMGDEPKYFTRDMRSALDLQYIICTDSTSDLYEVTDNGSNQVENQFSGNSVKKKTTSKRLAISKGVSEDIKKLEMVGTIDGFPDYFELPTKSDQILWLMQFSFEKNIKAVSPIEIEYMSLTLRGKIASSGFTALNERNIWKSFVSKTKDGFMIQNKGTLHLKSLIQKHE